jgi:hypothetical protein
MTVAGNGIPLWSAGLGFLAAPAAGVATGPMILDQLELPLALYVRARRSPRCRGRGEKKLPEIGSLPV